MLIFVILLWGLGNNGTKLYGREKAPKSTNITGYTITFLHNPIYQPSIPFKYPQNRISTVIKYCSPYRVRSRHETIEVSYESIVTKIVNDLSKGGGYE